MRFNKNLVLGVVMTILVFGIFSWLGYSLNFWETCSLFFLSYPWTIGKNIYSLWGGFSEEGSVYSLVGIVQVAKKNAIQLFGISFYQVGRNNVVQVIGISFYQGSEDDVWQALGISFWQVGGNSAGQLAGISFYQVAGNDAGQFLGISFYQKARYIENVISITMLQRLIVE